MRSIFEFLKIDPDIEINTKARYNVSTVSDYNPILVWLRRNKMLRSLRRNHTFKTLFSTLVPRSLLDKLLWRKASGSDTV